MEQLPHSSKLNSPPQEDLKMDLLAGKTTRERFLAELFALDQSTPERGNSESNLEILKSSDVEKVFVGTEHESDYWNALSFAYFHVAQRQALENPVGALEKFKASLVAAEHINGSDYEWKPYVAGTVAYFSKDIPGVHAAISALTEDASNVNRRILLSFVKGLQKRGEPNYIEDYSNRE